MTRRGDDDDPGCPAGAPAVLARETPGAADPQAPAAPESLATPEDHTTPGSLATPEGLPTPGTSETDWPPLVHAPDVDRETLLRRICGG